MIWSVEEFLALRYNVILAASERDFAGAGRAGMSKSLEMVIDRTFPIDSSHNGRKAFRQQCVDAYQLQRTLGIAMELNVRLEDTLEVRRGMKDMIRRSTILKR